MTAVVTTARCVDERGAVSLVVVTLLCVLAATAFGGAVGGSVLLGHRRAAAAADLAALAAAQAAAEAGQSPCEVARRVAGANHALLGHCRVEGLEVHVRVFHEVSWPVVGAVEVPAAARAGPAESPRLGPTPTDWVGPAP